MIRRGDSDFQWFKARVDSSHFSVASEYSDMATLHSALGGEPALLAKYYAEAVPPLHPEQEEDDTVTESLENSSDGPTSPSTSVSEALNGSVSMNGSGGAVVDDDKVVYEDYVDEEGVHLASARQDEEYEKVLRHNEEFAPRHRAKKMGEGKEVEKPQLATGRRAGAGWERSA